MEYPIVEVSTLFDSEKKFGDFLSKRYKINLRGCAANGTYISYLFRTPNRVVKVIGLHDDKAYEDYLKICLQHQSHKSFPKIYNVEIIKTRGYDKWRERTRTEKYLAITMERLYHNARKANVICDYAENFGNDFNYRYKRDFPSKGAVSSSLRTMIKARLFIEHHKDMHDGNIMFRKNGEAVFVDPVYS